MGSEMCIRDRLEAVERSDSNSPLVGEVKSLLEDRDFAEARCSSRYLD